MPTLAAMRGVPVTMQDAGTSATGNGTAYAIPPSFNNHRFTVITSAGVASGAVQFESADNATYAGTWNPLGGGPVTVPAASSEYEYNFNGVYGALRARISTIIGGGTITVTYEGS